jgi:hypothetical protein
MKYTLDPHKVRAREVYVSALTTGRCRSRFFKLCYFPKNRRRQSETPACLWGWCGARDCCSCSSLAVRIGHPWVGNQPGRGLYRRNSPAHATIWPIVAVQRPAINAMNCFMRSRADAEIFSSHALEISGCHGAREGLSFSPRHLGARSAENSDPLAVTGFQSAEVPLLLPLSADLKRRMNSRFAIQQPARAHPLPPAGGAPDTNPAGKARSCRRW